MDKVIIFGSTGLLGTNLILNLKKKYKIYASTNKKKINIAGVETFKVNFNKYFEIKKTISLIHPKIIFNAIGHTDVDYCEKNKEEAYFLNAKVPRILSSICKTYNIKFVHISTDHLSSGEYQYNKENDKMKPINIYAKSKLKGEKEIQKKLFKYLIVRANFFGFGTSYRRSFSDYIIDNNKKNKTTYLYSNIYFNPVFINNLIEIILKLIEKDKRGIYNIASNQKLSKYQFGLILTKKFNMNKNLIKEKIYKKNYQIKRPHDMSLSTKKIQKNLNIKLKTIEQEINDLYKFKTKQYFREISSL